MLNLSLDLSLSFETAGEIAVLWQMTRTRSLISAQAAGKIYRPSLRHRTRTQDEDRPRLHRGGWIGQRIQREGNRQYKALLSLRLHCVLGAGGIIEAECVLLVLSIAAVLTQPPQKQRNVIEEKERHYEKHIGYTLLTFCWLSEPLSPAWAHRWKTFLARILYPVPLVSLELVSLTR